jgi:hypothetical protein
MQAHLQGKSQSSLAPCVGSVSESQKRLKAEGALVLNAKPPPDREAGVQEVLDAAAGA